MRLRVKSVKEAGYEDVYCLTVPELHNFAVGGRGIFISNCDKIRYACMHAFPLVAEEDRRGDSVTVLG